VFKHDYDYTALDPGGQKVHGTIRVRNLSEAKALIRERGLFILSLTPHTAVLSTCDAGLRNGNGFQLDKALAMALIYIAVIAWTGYHAARPHWQNREWIRALANHGIQIEARVTTHEQALDGASKDTDAPAEFTWWFFLFMATAPDGQTCDGILTERPDFFSIQKGIYPTALLDEPPAVGETFTLTWVAADTPVFMPGIVGPEEVAKADRAFFIILGLMILLETVTLLSYRSYMRRGFVSRLFRPITHSPAANEVIFLRSQCSKARWAGLCFFVLATIPALGTLFKIRTFTPVNQNELIAMIFSIILCGGFATLLWSFGRTRIDRNTNQVYVKEGRPLANPFRRGQRYDFKSFRKVLLFNEWRRERGWGGRSGVRVRTIQVYIAGVALEGEGGSVNIFLYRGKWEKAGAVARDVALAVARFLDLEVSDTAGLLPPEGTEDEGRNGDDGRCCIEDK